MPKLTVEGSGTFDVPPDKRMVLALTDEAGIDQMHACGGLARCTTCRVEFVSGQPTRMTEAEKKVLGDQDLLKDPNLRLSCQIACDHDMSVRAISRVGGGKPSDAGKRPAPVITPPPVWTTR